jgi:hypothetical protein
VQQMGKHQTGRTGAYDSDLHAHACHFSGV